MAATSGLLDTTRLPNGPHVLGARALFTDNRTYDFYGESVTVANPPQNTALPTISGTLVPGQTISTSNGSWTANAPPTGFSYQWEHCDSSGLNCALISGATASTYTLSGADTNFTMRSVVTASNSGGSTAAVSAQTGVVPPPPLAITTSSLPGGIQNTSYSATVTATGGLSPYTWSITAGNLPTGLTLSPSSGVISGNPTVTGTSNFTVQVKDTRSVTTTMPLSLTVAVPLTVTTTSLPSGTQLASYSATLAATGGTPPYTWSISSGTLPSGLTLSSSSGLISGISTVTGTSNFTVQVRDANSLTNAKPLSLTMNGLVSGGSGIGLVQANSVQGSGVGSVSTAFPVSNTAGNLILAFVRMSTTSQTVTLSDSAGNTYVQAVAQVQNSDGSQARLFYAKNILGAPANTVTATFSSTNNHPWLAIYEFKGLSTTNPLDQVGVDSGQRLDSKQRSDAHDDERKRTNLRSDGISIHLLEHADGRKWIHHVGERHRNLACGERVHASELNGIVYRLLHSGWKPQLGRPSRHLRRRSARRTRGDHCFVAERDSELCLQCDADSHWWDRAL